MEGHEVRELPITDGWIVQDDNLLACSEHHIRSVFAMLKRQRKRAEFKGLEAARLKSWRVDLLADLRPSQMFFAYDTPHDYEPLLRAGRMLKEAGFIDQHLRAYVLIAQHRDTFIEAEARLCDTLKLGFMPFAMLYRDDQGNVDRQWQRFQRVWARPAKKMKGGR